MKMGLHRTMGSGLLVIGLMIGSSLVPPTAAQSSSIAEKPIELPPFIVEQVNVGPPWSYTATPCAEYLSRCDNAITDAFVRGELHSRHLTDLILPKTFQEQGDVKETVILYSQYLKPQIPKALMEEMVNADRDAKHGKRPSTIGILPNLRLLDKDCTAGFVYIEENRFSGHVFFTPDYIRVLLERRTPQLPSWFIDGFVLFYSGIEFHEDGLVFRRSGWISRSETENIKNDPEYPCALLPMQELFVVGTDRAAPVSGLVKRTRDTQTYVFIRWALSGRKERKLAFWKFVERSCLEPPTEALFEECFGFGYAEARDRLSDYLPMAVKEPVLIESGSYKRPTYKIRNANDDEIIRIKGDWERMQIGYVRKLSPQFAMRYQEQAWKTLSKVHALDKPAPELSMTLGFFESERSNDDAARVLLEQAVKARVVRPRAYLELGRLRFAEAKLHPHGANGKISSDQTAWVLEPLALLQDKKPRMLDCFLLFNSALNLSEQQPTKEQLAVIASGVRFFPKSGRLALQACGLFLLAGDKAGAAELLELGMTFCEDSQIHERMLIVKEKFLKVRTETLPAKSGAAAKID